MPIDPTEYGRNNHTISRDQYRINPGFISEGVIRLGEGVDMNDPGAPQRRAGRSPFTLPMVLQASDVSDYTLDESFRFVEASSAREEAEILGAYFQGSYRFVSADAAYKRAESERATSHSIYAVVESTGETRDLSELMHGQPLEWNQEVAPAFEGTAADPQTFRRQFLLDFGSHYVSAVNYGYRLAIRGKITTTDAASSETIKAAFKATFLAASAEGGVSKEAKQTLSGSHVELTFVATSGGLFRDGEHRPGILTRLEDIIETLRDLRSGAMTIHGAPLTAVVRTYWNLLPPEFALSRALLTEHGEPPPPEGFFGVPAGTIVAWRPGERAIYTDDAGRRHLVPPDGWAVCDGGNGTPDLRDRFVRGAPDVEAIGAAAGSPSHTHVAAVTKNKSPTEVAQGIVGGKAKVASSTHAHDVSVTGAAVDPPHVKLAFIMRL